MKFKYVMNSESSPARFVLIPDIGMKHSDIAGNWTSAGFASIGYDNSTHRFMCDCYGESVSLGLTAGKEDNIIIERYMNPGF